MTLNEFQSWALSQGQVGNPGSGSYPGQCVSLVQQYLDKVYGIPYLPRGNAKDWPTNPDVLSYFDKVSDLKDGDIIVYGADYGGGYGHIGIKNGQFLDQNGHKSLHVAVGAVFPNPIAYLRRKGTSPVGDPMATPSQVNYQFVIGTGRAATQDDIDAWTVKTVAELADAIEKGAESKIYRDKVNAALAGSKFVKVTKDLYEEVQ